MNLFYPSHDIALGNGVKHFNPPFAALRLQEDLADLSKIWNADGSIIPWAWDYDTRSYINKEYKIKLKDLPSDEDLQNLRELSSRKTTIDIIRQLKKLSDDFDRIKVPSYIDSEEKLRDIIENQKNFVLKMPWSSSGRGLSRSDVWTKESLLNHGLSTIRKMGGIIAEQWYNKIQDFAMLFYIGKEKIDFIGYSLFDNDDSGTYRSGKLMSNEMIEASLPPVCSNIQVMLTDILKRLFSPFMNKPWEIGYIGIDMMIAEEDDTYFIHPCIEMNLRCTMGVVARLYYDKNCTEDMIGDFYITPAMDNEKLIELDSNLNNIYKNKYRRLTDIGKDSMFMAYAVFA